MDMKEQNTLAGKVEIFLEQFDGFSILIGCLHRTIVWFSLFFGLFQRVKILHKMNHNARQSDTNIIISVKKNSLYLKIAC